MARSGPRPRMIPKREAGPRWRRGTGLVNPTKERHMNSRIAPCRQARRSHLAPGVNVDTHKRELLASAIMALQESRANSIFRERLLPDDPSLADVPAGHFEAVEISAAGPVELVNQWNVRGLFKLRAVSLRVATAH